MTSNSMRDTSKVSDFIVKLYQLLKIENPLLVSWRGGVITIHNPVRFASELLPKYYRHSRFSSFTRNLNKYGFRKKIYDFGNSHRQGKLSPCSFFHADLAESDGPTALLNIRLNNSKSRPTYPGIQKCELLNDIEHALIAGAGIKRSPGIHEEPATKRLRSGDVISSNLWNPGGGQQTSTPLTSSSTGNKAFTGIGVAKSRQHSEDTTSGSTTGGQPTTTSNVLPPSEVTNTQDSTITNDRNSSDLSKLYSGALARLTGQIQRNPDAEPKRVESDSALQPANGLENNEDVSSFSVQNVGFSRATHDKCLSSSTSSLPPLHPSVAARGQHPTSCCNTHEGPPTSEVRSDAGTNVMMPHHPGRSNESHQLPSSTPSVTMHPHSASHHGKSKLVEPVMENCDIASLDDFLSAVMMVSPYPSQRHLDPTWQKTAAEEHQSLITALINSPHLRSRELPRKQQAIDATEVREENGFIITKENGVLVKKKEELTHRASNEELVSESSCSSMLVENSSPSSVGAPLGTIVIS